MDQVEPACMAVDKIGCVNACTPSPGGIQFKGHKFWIGIFQKNIDHCFAVINVEVIVVVVISVTQTRSFCLLPQGVEQFGFTIGIIAAFYAQHRAYHITAPGLGQIRKLTVCILNVDMSADGCHTVARQIVFQFLRAKATVNTIKQL